eukprot:TRINITY_DN87_c0_g1_i1.p1 TRINITY_DN87_c0_g1~~TRINITY_DN87_c0_g1_i1.p1  ORF type:complete len:1450 (+),score=653.87 TRINITY_DN87_c0_g1_i1:1167-5516(+)
MLTLSLPHSLPLALFQQQLQEKNNALFLENAQLNNKIAFEISELENESERKLKEMERKQGKADNQLVSQLQQELDKARAEAETAKKAAASAAATASTNAANAVDNDKIEKLKSDLDALQQENEQLSMNLNDSQRETADALKKVEMLEASSSADGDDPTAPLIQEIDNLQQENRTNMSKIESLNQQIQELKENAAQPSTTPVVGAAVDPQTAEKVQQLEIERDQLKNQLQVALASSSSSTAASQNDNVASQQQIADLKAQLLDLENKNQTQQSQHSIQIDSLQSELDTLRKEVDMEKENASNAQQQLQDTLAAFAAQDDDESTQSSSSADKPDLPPLPTVDPRRAEIEQRLNEVEDEISPIQAELEQWKEDFIEENGHDPGQDDFKPIKKRMKALKKLKKERTALEDELNALPETPAVVAQPETVEQPKANKGDNSSGKSQQLASQLAAEIKAKNEALKELQQSRLDLDRQLASQETELRQKAAQDSQNLQDRIAELEQQLDQAKVDIEKAKQSAAANPTMPPLPPTTPASTSTSSTVDDKMVKDLQAQLAALQSENETLKANATASTSTDKQSNDAPPSTEDVVSSAEYKKLQQQQDDLQRELASAQAQLQAASGSDGDSEQVTILQEEISTLNTKIGQERDSHTSEIGAKDKIIADLQETHREKLDTLRQQHQQEIDSLKEQIAAKTKELVEAKEGFAETLAHGLNDEEAKLLVESVSKENVELETKLEKADQRAKDAAGESESLRQSIKESGDKILQLETQKRDLDAQIADLQSQIEGLNNQISQMEQSDSGSAATPEADLKKAQRQVTKLEGETQRLSDRVAQMKSDHAMEINAVQQKWANEFEQTTNDLQKQKSDLQEKLQEQQQANEKLKQTVGEKEAKIMEITTRLANMESTGSSEVEKVKKELEDYRAQMEAESKEKDSAHQQQITEISSQHEEEKKELSGQLQEASEQLSTAQVDLKEAGEKIETLTREIEELRSAQSEAEAKHAEMQEQLKVLDEWMEKANSFEEELTMAQAYTKDVEERLRKEQKERKDLHNKIQLMKGAIRVFARCRPASSKERKREGYRDVVIIPDPMTVELDNDDEEEDNKSFHFDGAFGADSTQLQMAEASLDLVRSACDGYNVCIFAYGQTGSGKTYTMYGDLEDGSDNQGITPRALRELFHICESEKKVSPYSIEVYMCELYLDNLRDLLYEGADNKRPKLDPKLDQNDGLVKMSTITTVPVTSVEEVVEVMNRGLLGRKTTATEMNDASSRSHLVFSLLIKRQQRKKKKNKTIKVWKVGKLSLVDLAGSERPDKTGNDVGSKAFKEGIAINQSLTALGGVIHELAENKKGAHISYRSSMLTRLMQDSLGGNAKTLMIVCISPADYNISETATTLDYGTRVQKITNEVVQNVETEKTLRMHDTIKSLRKELKKLKKQYNVVDDEDDEDDVEVDEGDGGEGSST